MIVMKGQLCSYEQKLQACNAYCIVHKSLKCLIGGMRIIRAGLLSTELGRHFEIPPYVIGHHDNLKEGVVVFEFGRRDSIKTLPLGLTDKVLYICPFIIKGDKLVRLSL